jgi:LPXTG-site transpeptidase (sortase) family protein
MNFSGLIYDSSWQRSAGAVWLDLPQSQQIASKGATLIRCNPLGSLRNFPKLAANLMLLVGSAGLLLTMLPVAAIEIKYNLSNLANSPNSANFNSPPPPTPTPAPGPANSAEAFSVSIPKIAAGSVVIPNVDPADPKIYMEQLKKGVAHALGTGLPGVESDINRTIYLFSHSTSAPSLVAQYNAQFYLLNKLEIGDDINVVFWAQNYKYRVAEIKITAPDDVSFLTPQTDKELLVLATCTPPGTTWKRLLVIAERV